MEEGVRRVPIRERWGSSKDEILRSTGTLAACSFFFSLSSLMARARALQDKNITLLKA